MNYLQLLDSVVLLMHVQYEGVNCKSTNVIKMKRKEKKQD